MTIEFWYSLISPYAYLTALRIERVLEGTGIGLKHEPMALPPIYRALGWQANPFADRPYKLPYVWRDIGRTAAKYGLPFRKPRTFPQDPYPGTRVALVGFEQGWGWDFAKRFYAANFQRGENIASERVIGRILQGMRLDARAILSRARDERYNRKIERQTKRALKKGVFGAPFFFVGREPFWGNDRLEDAIAFARFGTLTPNPPRRKGLRKLTPRRRLAG